MLGEAMCTKYNYPVLKADRTWNDICIKINNKGRGTTFRLKLAKNLRLRLGGGVASRSETSNSNSDTSSKESK